MRMRVLLVLSLGVAVVSLSCARMRGERAARTGASASELVDRALAAQGGAEAVGKVRALAVKGGATYWEPEQSVKAGGEARLAAEGGFAITRDLDAGSARTEWVKKFVYPAPREYRFTETVTPSAGHVLGIDSTARTKQSQESNPPQHTMSGVRLAATQRELLRSSPRLLLDMKQHASEVTRVPDEDAGGVKLPAVRYQTGDIAFTVLFDPKTGLPERVRTLDSDNIHGDSTFDLVLGDWREVDGVKFAQAQRYELNGNEVVRIRNEEIQVNPAVAAGTFELPAEVRAAAKRAAGEVPYQWVIRRQHIGTYLDSDAIHYDPAASPGLRLADVAPGVHQVVGGTHNALVVELPDSLAVVDAPIDSNQTRWTLDALRAKYPSKPVKHIILTHHHMDHAGGTRAYVAHGATLVVGAGNGEHFRRALAQPDRLGSGARAQAPRSPEIVEVSDRMVLGGKLEIYPLANPHAEGMLLAYVPEAKLGFVTDVWSPGRDKLGETLTPGQAAVVAAVQKYGITPEKFAGGHGTVADYASLLAVAGNR